jgi:hypothetical protein
MVPDPDAFEQAGELVAERIPLDAVEVEHRSMGREAGPDCRDRVTCRPIDELYQCAPVRLISQGWCTRLCTCHDQAIDVVCPKLADVLVMLPDVGTASPSTLDSS